MKILVSTLFLILGLSTAAMAQPAKPAPAPSPSPSPSPSPAPAAVDLTGKWGLAADAGGQTVNIQLELKQTGTEFKGTSVSDVGNGTIEGGKVTGKTFTAVLKSDVQGTPVEFKFEGTVDGEKMTGNLSNPGFGSFPVSGSRVK